MVNQTSDNRILWKHQSQILCRPLWHIYVTSNLMVVFLNTVRNHKKRKSPDQGTVSFSKTSHLRGVTYKKYVNLPLCMTDWTLCRENILGGVDVLGLDVSTRWTWVVSFTPRPRYSWGKSPGTHWMEGWLGTTASLSDIEKGQFLTLQGPLKDSPRPKTIWKYINS